MFEVLVWVPTRGWKLLLECDNERRAVELYEQLVPLEVKLRKDGVTIREHNNDD
jgi:hypothetical protein